MTCENTLEGQMLGDKYNHLYNVKYHALARDPGAQKLQNILIQCPVNMKKLFLLNCHTKTQRCWKMLLRN
jgi:hypothetical protein